MCVLFADTADSTVAVLMAVSGVLGAALTKGGDFIVGIWRERRGWKKADEKSIVDRQDETIKSLTNELRSLQVEVSRVRNVLIQAVSHVMYLEGKMEDANMKFRPFDRRLLADPGSSEVRVESEPGGEEPTSG